MELLNSPETLTNFLLRKKGKIIQRTFWRLMPDILKHSLHTRNDPANHNTTGLSIKGATRMSPEYLFIFYFKFLLSCTFSFIRKAFAISLCFILTINITELSHFIASIIFLKYMQTQL